MTAISLGGGTQQIDNGGFEDGYSQTAWLGGAEITASEKRTGSYGLAIYGHPNTYQLIDNVAVNDVQDFGFYCKGTGATSAYCKIVYTDASSTTIPLTPHADWTLFTATLDAGKIINAIEFHGFNDSFRYIDDVSLTVTADLVNVIEFSCFEDNNISVPKWINQNPDIDENVWNKSVLELNYTLRCTDAEKYMLDQLQLTHSEVELHDDTFIVSPYIYFGVWIKEMTSTYAADEDYAYPWRIELKLIVLAKY